MSATGTPSDPRVAVVIHPEGRWLPEATASIREPEPVDVIVEGTPRESTAPYVFALDGGDLIVAGILGSMADRLDADPDLGACYGDYLEFGGEVVVREVPEDLEADALAAGRYPSAAMFRRATLEVAGDPLADLKASRPAGARWAELLRAGATVSHMGTGVPTFLRRASEQPTSAAGWSQRTSVADEVRYEELLRTAREDPPLRPAGSDNARIAVLIACFNDGPFAVTAAASVREREPVEVWVVDDGSTERETHEALDRLEGLGCTVVRLGQNRGPAPARNQAMERSKAPYVFPLDADDLVVPGSLARLADALDADPCLAAAYGDIEELTDEHRLIRASPPDLDPFRIAYVNEMPLGSLYRKASIAPLGGWRDPSTDLIGYEDWDLWMTLAEQGARCVRIESELPVYRYRLHASRMTASTRRKHAVLYGALRERHRRLFEALPEHRRRSHLGLVRKALYPYVYGGRKRYAFERPLKAALDAAGVWTRRR